MTVPILSPSPLARPNRAFGDVLLSSFSKFGYAYCRTTTGTNSVAQVKRVARTLLASGDSKLFEDTTEHVATRSLRGPYRFRAASGVDDDIRCWSVGNPRQDLGELRGPFYRRSSHQNADEILALVGEKRNVWPTESMPEAKTVLEEYYDSSCTLSENIAASIEMSLLGLSDDDTTSLMWPKWMHRCDSHLEAKLYAGVTASQIATPSSATAAVSSPSSLATALLKKSKILRRGSSGGKLPVAEESESSDPQRGNTDGAHTLKKTRMDVHADLSVVTLLLQDSQGGLEVFDSERHEFVTVPVFPEVEDVVLVHAGKLLELWSGGEILATPHRVRTVPGCGSRCSVVFFSFPDFDATISSRRCAPFTAGDLHPALL